ncbi:MAG: hypothetical protein J6V50_04905, partial [Clostridia bacterium]|nr:hypothetical protein [Clostridia bacterium]
GTFTVVYVVGVGGGAVVEGLSLKIGNINDKVWESKLDAIENARKIVEKMPKNLGEAEKAKYLHSYTVENVDYFDYGDKDKNITYLYDGIVGGKTNCDGSTNMYALLLNIAGVDCYEKWHKGEGETSGHTWNMVEIDGVWYNVDATSPLNKENFDIEVFQKRYFAFEDRMQKYAPAYGEIYPEVKANLEGGIYTHINKIDTKSVADTAKKALSESEDKYVLFLVDEYSEDASLAVAQRLANSLYKTVYSLKYEVMGGKHLLAFYL